MWTCGDSSEGATGRGEDADDVSTPSMVPLMEERELVGVACGTSCCLVLERGGLVYYWGTMGESGGKKI